jgi:hypothetical protein
VIFHLKAVGNNSEKTAAEKRDISDIIPANSTLQLDPRSGLVLYLFSSAPISRPVGRNSAAPSADMSDAPGVRQFVMGFAPYSMTRQDRRAWRRNTLRSSALRLLRRFLGEDFTVEHCSTYHAKTDRTPGSLPNIRPIAEGDVGHQARAGK